MDTNTFPIVLWRTWHDIPNNRRQINPSVTHGFCDVPEVWQNSSYTRGYDSNINLRSKYGDPRVFALAYLSIMATMARIVYPLMTCRFIIKQVGKRGQDRVRRYANHKGKALRQNGLSRPPFFSIRNNSTNVWSI